MRSALTGRRIRLLRCSDSHTKLKPGALGTVSMVDDLGTVHIDWDDGSTLGLVPGEDRWEVLGTEVVCRACDGDGIVSADASTPSNERVTRDSRRCDYCRGKGTVPL